MSPSLGCITYFGWIQKHKIQTNGNIEIPNDPEHKINQSVTKYLYDHVFFRAWAAFLTYKMMTVSNRPPAELTQALYILVTVGLRTHVLEKNLGMIMSIIYLYKLNLVYVFLLQ